MDNVNISLKTIAGNKSQLVEDDKPQIVFCGRSNVGKSSLINTMANRKKIARVSSAPGKTRTINFYSIEDEFYFVDLPGYGYAKVSNSIISNFGKLIEFYLKKNNRIKIILLLLDIRHEPTEDDRLMYEFLKYYNYRMAIVATKVDKVSNGYVRAHKQVIRDKLRLDDTVDIFNFSSLKKTGRNELWQLINSIK